MRFPLAALILTLLAPWPARPQAEPELAAGCILVADRHLRDTNFAQAVILIARYDEDGTVGLILNRRGDSSIATVLKDWKEAQGRTDPVFSGGPVQNDALLALVRSRAKLAGGNRIVDDVHLIADETLMRKQLGSVLSPLKIRVFLGYAGWGSEQLENEIELGAWHVFPGTANVIFDPEPDTLWSRLIRNSETQIASVRQPVAKREQRLIARAPAMQRSGTGFGPGIR